MNADSLKTELQQVLENDLVLRKEFNELRRSLSDYRNQLIMRDEDCKRLQVTIDVLNTKLVVMERDNNNYKSELASFKELRGSIKEQLQAKQEEIDQRLELIETLKSELNSVSAEYELKIQEIKVEANYTLENVKSDYNLQIEELKTNSYYKESGIKDEFENRLNELSSNWADKEQSLILNHQDEIVAVKQAYEQQITFLKNDYNSQIHSLSSNNQSEVDSLKVSGQLALESLENEYTQKIESLENSYNNQIIELKAEIEIQKNSITHEFTLIIENLKNEYCIKEKELISSYETQIEELNNKANLSSDELNSYFQSQINNLKSEHENLVNELTNGYEEKLSNALIHSNAQNSKFSEELNKYQLDSEQANEKIKELTAFIESQNTEFENLKSQLFNYEIQLNDEANKFIQLTNEFDLFKQNSLLSNSEQVNTLNLQIENLNNEISNLSSLLEITTNNLGETEVSLELRNQEIINASNQIEALNNQVSKFEHELSEKGIEFKQFKEEVENLAKQQILDKDIEFQKLLVENSSLINEIDSAQDKIDAQAAELELLRTELMEIKTISAAKTEEFKEILTEKNFSITNSEGENAGLKQEINQLKSEIFELNSIFESYNSEKTDLYNQISESHSNISQLNTQIEELNNKVYNYEIEIESLKQNQVSNQNEEQSIIIEDLYKKVEDLLEEKNLMAEQLLKMNSVVGEISQEVDNQNIDVMSLSNHRKNVILANNSEENNEKTLLKKQINDLVREIDKCIMLLSA